MKKIKMLLSVALCACALAFAAACSKAPDDVALKVMEAFRDGKTSVLNDYCTEDAAMGFTVIGAAARDELKGTKFKVISTDIDGNTAEVTMKMTKDGDSDTSTIILKKIGGDWKVDDMD